MYVHTCSAFTHCIIGRCSKITRLEISQQNQRIKTSVKEHKNTYIQDLRSMAIIFLRISICNSWRSPKIRVLWFHNLVIGRRLPATVNPHTLLVLWWTSCSPCSWKISFPSARRQRPLHYSRNITFFTNVDISVAWLDAKIVCNIIPWSKPLSIWITIDRRIKLVN